MSEFLLGSNMTPNIIIVLILITIPVFAFALWKFGIQVMNAVGHGVLMSKVREEARAEEETRKAFETQLVEINAAISAHQAHNMHQDRVAQESQAPQKPAPAQLNNEKQ
ncbi:hypothetical protein FQN57_005919 [Myotisia sp. PD_48]|nr:hypothetical protein FQN57_005919 [Myotisia sp. PD_48]